MVYIGLVLNARGLDRALASVGRDGERGVDEINYVVVATDEFSQRNQGMSTRQSLAQWAEVGSRARAAGLRTTLTIAALLCAHIGAALFHHFVRKDDILLRMVGR